MCKTKDNLDKLWEKKDLEVACHELYEGIILTGAGQNEKRHEQLNQDSRYIATSKLNVF
jgi:hypothetical protein